MKRGATKVVLLFRDSEGFASSIFDALRPSPNSSLLHAPPEEESIELSLERYGIHEQKASAKIIHYVDPQVSLLLMENYEPPVLACAVTEVLSQLTGEEPSLMPTLIVPFVLALSMLKCERKSSITKESRPSVYRIQVGPERDITQVLAIRTEKAPPSLQIHHEPATCLLQLVRVLKLPTCVLIGQRGRLLSDKAIGEELKILYEIGELLASATGLCFSRERIVWQPTNASDDSKEPWRALYG
ncbi:hypothetical protein CJ030_MR6G005860 [Morella rubra]|uniref:DUF7894 domain-containing protein n=1 Tax=Morella rubra TaxID=262757 RepID=A0A6A1V7T9_9ROSI|nr:hypothetical protein CJ030_MR6G005860 [Morella rubra]